MKIYFINLGCKVNFAELSRLKDIFDKRGYSIDCSILDADIVLINTCSVTKLADADSRRIIRMVRRENPKAFIGVLGCYAQLEADKILELTGASAIFGINRKFEIPDIIEKLVKEERRVSLVEEIDNTKFDFAFSADNEARARAFMKLQDGCNFKCSYCTIPLARGNSRSLSFSEVLPQVEKIVSAGYKEIVLTGINLSDYRSDDKNFYDLIKLFATSDFPVRFRISSIEPQIINEQLVEIIANHEKICPHFHIPLQSGSNEILKKMKRRYNVEQFQRNIELIKNYIPEACIGLDVISGFPGETEALFRETYEFIQSLDISYLHCFSYSKRANTLAAELENQVPKQEKRRRTRELSDLSKWQTEKYYKNNIGKCLTFLPEKFDVTKNKVFGHTENYINVCIPVTKPLDNIFYTVKLTSYDGKYAIGELI